MAVCNIRVGRYSNPEQTGGWAGWIEPEDLSWIVFVRKDGSVQVYLNRDPKTGAVLD
jgi:hypothetical protein